MHALNGITSSSGIRFSIFFQPVMEVEKQLTQFEKKNNYTSMSFRPLPRPFKRYISKGRKDCLKIETFPPESQIAF